MSSVTIEVDNKIWANSIALWFESGDAINAFMNSYHYEILEEIAETEHIPDFDDVVVEFDQDETIYTSNHTVIIELA